jgi:carbamoyl-phosphate synthase large subunit
MAKRGHLVLEDGFEVSGTCFGAEVPIAGEVVFSTGMVGYPESLTDPSFAGQILVLTYPLVGNYGVPDDSRDEFHLPRHFESERIQVAGLVVSTLSHDTSHWEAERSLHGWLEQHGVPGLAGVDTRELAKRIREEGAMLAKLVPDGEDVDWHDPNLTNLVASAGVREPVEYGTDGPRVVLVDTGAKANIVRSLVRAGARVLRVPWDYDFHGEQFDGLFLSNGPGDPKLADATIGHVRKALELKVPTFGICLGNQLLALAAGADTYKLKFGHRSQNQPCIEVGTRLLRHVAEPRFRRRRIDPPGRLALVVRQCERRDQRGHPARVDSRAQRAVPSRGDARADRYGLPVPAIRGDTPVNVPPAAAGELNLPKSVLILGSSALKIGEAGEFDYSGSQAIKALKEEGIRTILVNPNIATIQTSEYLADDVYFLPVTPEFVRRVIEKERPEGLLLGFGGQTALNCGLALADTGVLDEFAVRVLGTQIETIRDTEDRGLFTDRLAEIGAKTPVSKTAHGVDEAIAAASEIGYPVMLRIAYALGGLGSGICRDEEELRKRAEPAFAHTSQVLVEEYLKGWKEIEYEVVRDAFDNCVTVCNMENMDPMGIHTGESIVVAPSQSLTNHEYHKLREVAIRVIRHLGIVGECNIQYALDPGSDDYRIIEVNARLSRSSALASKATGYPLAFVAAKLALGHALTDVPNHVTGVTQACFEPALDYVVVKVPRWDLKKFRRVSTRLGSGMKSVGEVMGIGRTFEEAFQKALRMLDIGVEGVIPERSTDFEDLEFELSEPTDRRAFALARAFQAGMSVEQVGRLTRIDPWFLSRVEGLVRLSERLERSAPDGLDAGLLADLKASGFSDRQIAELAGLTQDEVREARRGAGIRAVVKQIDTLAAEYPARTNYLYLTYNGSFDDVEKSDRQPILVLGPGAYRIGSSVEFDWCCVNTVRTLRELGYQTVMLNCNPETVSTDYDECDRLYFDEITFETVREVYEAEGCYGLIVSMGGQTPNNLALRCAAAGMRVLGTSASNIDTAEDRHKFSALCDRLDVDQPAWTQVSTVEAAEEFAGRVGYPVLVRPSYVLSGAAMAVAENEESLHEILERASEVSAEHPTVISKFITGAKEIEVDAVARKGEIVVYAISEHVENAGVHSGDATLVLPPQRTYIETTRRARRIATKVAQALNINGPFNIQFMARDNKLMVIECNLRASRSFPFASKIFKINFIDLATRVIMERPTPRIDTSIFELDYVGVKAPQFSFTRLDGADPVLGVEMASTGEVGCIGEDFEDAFLKALLSVGYRLPIRRVLVSAGPLEQKAAFLSSTRALAAAGVEFFATRGTASFFHDGGVEATAVAWPLEKGEPNALELIRRREVDLVINIPKDSSQEELVNDYMIRRAAVDHGVPLVTNIQLAQRLAEAVLSKSVDQLEIRSWDEY